MGKRNKTQQRAQRRGKLTAKRKKKYSIVKHIYNNSSNYKNYDRNSLKQIHKKIIKCLKKDKILCAKNYYFQINRFIRRRGELLMIAMLIKNESPNIRNNQNYILGKNEKIKIIYSLKNYKSRLLIKPFYYLYLGLIKMKLMKLESKYDIIKLLPIINIYGKFNIIDKKYHSNAYYEILEK